MTPDIDPATRAAIDDAIDEAMARIRGRADRLGESFTALADALARAMAGGKRFRPALVAASFHAFAGRADTCPALFPVAAAFELLHGAFVVHDDVIDHDVMRRGSPNVSGEFRARGAERGAGEAAAADLGNAAAILGGDLLLYEATRFIALAEVPRSRRDRLLELFDDAVIVSAAGELADVENALIAATSDPIELLETAYDKTAVYSFAAPLGGGAVLAGATDAELDALRDSGGRLGLAYQLVDDLIGAFGSREQAGREPGSDLREAKSTPLIALARESEAWHKVSSTLAVAHTGPIAVLHAQRALDASGARERLCALIDETLDSARVAARPLPERVRALVDDIAARILERIP